MSPPVAVLSYEQHFYIWILDLYLDLVIGLSDRLCGLVVRVLDYRSGGPG
jgi:hypothetical protein